MSQNHTAPAIPAPSRSHLRFLLPGGVAAGPLFLGAGLLQGLTREGFDFGRNALSQLSLGSLGWIQIGVFLATGALLIVGAVGTRHAMREAPGGVWAPWMIAVFGASFLVAGVFTADPGAGFPVGAPETAPPALSGHGAVHMIAGMIGYLALCTAFLMLARYFTARRARGWALACRLVPLSVIAGFAASAATVAAFTAGAAIGLLWLSAVLLRLAAQPQRP
ncbi:hypothetical protein BJF83_23710 [Nocardiopsis sp. CNR-923]|uniref:DUF998 domain-containing protein n=1 Tax=Nocardiopsis sp. CNR-923 TaxID=1904965 RepID=UPI00096633C6|nr:DUF998 domain-containing protein [Nocardiopsis sp. CNR-923]OLT24884.1 hypothetical protein BJF83_23710 [Nocardiopsis sp. CNR-923]